jgi:hypothetical protein
VNPYQVILTIGGWTSTTPVEVTAGTEADAAATAVRLLLTQPPGPVQRAVVQQRRVYGPGLAWLREVALVVGPGGDPASATGWRAA